ncbi:DUF4157 domain-containing protein [Nannocystaceae bacterium ST9]
MSERTHATKHEPARAKPAAESKAEESDEASVNPRFLAWALNGGASSGAGDDEAEAEHAADRLDSRSESRPESRPEPDSHEHATLEQRPSSSLGRPLGPGRALPSTLREEFDDYFGHDLSPVRVHTDTRDGALARSHGARAYARGRDVVFGAGQYQPHTPAGRRSLAHELAHVVQQLGRPGARAGAASVTPGRASVGIARDPAPASGPATVDEVEAAMESDPPHAANLLNGMWMVDMLATLTQLQARGKPIAGLLGVAMGAGPESANRLEAAVLAVTRSNPSRLLQLLAPTGGLEQLQQRMEIRGFLGGAANGAGGTFSGGVLAKWQWLMIGDYVRIGNRAPFAKGQVVGALPWMAFNPGDLTGDLVKPKDRNQQEFIWTDTKAIPDRVVRGDLGIYPSEESGRAGLQTWITKRYAGKSIGAGAAEHLGGKNNANLVKGVDDPDEYGRMVVAYLQALPAKPGRPQRTLSSKFDELQPDEWAAVLDAFAEAEDYGNIGLEFSSTGRTERNENDLVALEAKTANPSGSYQRPGGKAVAARWRAEYLRKALAKIGTDTPPEIVRLYLGGR